MDKISIKGLKIALPRGIEKDPTLKSATGFIAWIKANDNFNGRTAYDKAVSFIENNAAEYQEALNKFGVEIGKAFSSVDTLPLGLCGSILEAYGIKLPASIETQLPIEILLDEFFALGYDTSRIERRFQPGVVEAIGNKIKEKWATPEEFWSAVEQDPDIQLLVLSVGTDEDLIRLYGRQEVKLWWRSMSDEEVKKWYDETSKSTENFMYETLESTFGGHPGLKPQ